MKTISWEEGEKRLLSNAEVLKECQKLEPEFRVLRELIHLRKEKKISQEELATSVKMKQSNVARLERGESTPTLKMLQKYAEALGQVINIEIVPKKRNSETKPLFQNILK